MLTRHGAWYGKPKDIGRIPKKAMRGKIGWKSTFVWCHKIRRNMLRHRKAHDGN